MKESRESKIMLKELFIFFTITLGQSTSTPDSTLAAFLEDVNQKIALIYDQQQLAFLQNELLGANDLIAQLQSELAYEKLVNYLKSIRSRLAKFKRLRLGDALQRRQLERIPELGYDAMDDMELAQIYELMANLSDSYEHVKLCAYRQPFNCSLRLIPDVQRVVQQSRDLAEIEYYWLEWRRCAGLAKRQQFVQFMELYKKTAKANGYNKPVDYWFRQLELSGQQSMGMMDKLMSELQPLLLQFHAHVRGSLRKMYGVQLVQLGKPYPQHLAEIFLGNSYRRDVSVDWFIDIPSRDVGLPNITEALHRRGLSTTQRVFWNVAEYYRGLGLIQLESSLWSNAHPVSAHNEDSCWHKAWHFHSFSRDNFSYCPLQDEERFFNMFEAQFELYYSRAAAAQPMLLREEPFPNFREALGKCFALAASSPRYLRKLGLLREAEWSRLPARLNRLYVQGLRVIFLLPIFYVLDRYRVEVLSGQIRADDNEAYWRLTERFTGATAPSRRTNEHFDVPAKLLLEVDDQYTSHFLSIVLQFQLFKHFCLSTGQYVIDSAEGPLDLCDLSDKREIGVSLNRAMALGSSLHYKEVLQQLLGNEDLSMDGLLTYFKPLQDWLTQQNRANGLEVGWV